ncbi:hypothetical protein HHK36_002796 [Tetracentron sinense]|uniref:Branched-chain-amino-acid aminotransferase n=1 Tax=Tetracentron sinense TaxID=13715 RepID=A0A834ZWC7_TETSI|nr:hypothetical protein HHK36_002796 [Tetracentron sinense]
MMKLLMTGNLYRREIRENYCSFFLGKHHQNVRAFEVICKKNWNDSSHLITVIRVMTWKCGREWWYGCALTALLYPLTITITITSSHLFLEKQLSQCFEGEQEEQLSMIHRSNGLRSLIQFSRLGSSFSKLGPNSPFTSQAASSLQQLFEPTTSYRSDDEYANVNWDELGFGLTPTDYMYVMKCSINEKFSEGELNRYGNIELSPSSGVLNYGQGLFEGLKAYRREDGRLLLFRPEQNALRMKIGAERMCMPSPSVEQFVDAVKQTALANKRWIPPPGKGSLYMRPLLIGNGPVLGLAPAPDYTFLIYASPVGNYFKEGLAPLNLVVEDKFHRAAPGGTGGVKTITNYAPVLKAQAQAKSKGFSDVLFLDSVNKKNIEELSSCNIFIVKGNAISTPDTNGTILAGITRKSIIDIARGYGYQVEERPIPVEDLIDADEVFCTGTAVVVAPVGNITYLGKRVEYKTGAGAISRKLQSTLTGIQTGLIEDKMGWTVVIG